MNIRLALVVLVSFVGLIASESHAAAAGNDLRALCANNSISLGKLSQLDELVTKLDNDLGGECGKLTVSAIRDLKQVVHDNRNIECSLEAYQNFREFYLRYLDTSAKEKKEAVAAIPKSLRRFALAYGVQLSGLCRANMVQELIASSSKLISDQDLEAVQEMIDPKGPIADALGSSSDRPDEIILPSDFMAVLKGDGDEVGGQQINLQIQTTPLIKRIQVVCERRFEPIYEPLMFPVARMANLGFDHRKAVLKEAIRKAENKRSKETRGVIGQWTRIVFLCEAMKQVKLVESAEDAARSEGNDVKRVRVESKSEAGDGGQERDLLEEAKVDLDSIKRVQYKPNLSVTLSDEICVTAGQKRAAEHVNTDRDEIANIRQRMLMKVLRQLWGMMSKYKVGSLARKVFGEIKLSVKKMMDAKQSHQSVSSNVGTDLVKSMNELVQLEFRPERAVAKSKGGDDIYFWVFIFCCIMLTISLPAAAG